MSPAPGVTVTTRASQAGSGFDIETGTAFLVGASERGSTDGPVLCRDLNQFVAAAGGRLAGSSLYDAARSAFRNGLSRLYFSRVVGTTPTKATVTLDDGDGDDTLVVTAKNPGSWGADLDVVIAAGVTVGTFTITVKDDDVIVEVSPELADKTAAIVWADSSDYIDLADADVTDGDPAVGTFSLTGGTDDSGTISTSHYVTALNRFGKDLGPGQVAAPGKTTQAIQEALLNHAADRNRYAIVDLPDTATRASLVSATGALHTHINARYGLAVEGWYRVSDQDVPGILRDVPPSAGVLGAIARSDASSAHANTAVAGDNGVIVDAIERTRAEWSDDDRSVLNDAGVNVIRNYRGAHRLYGFRSLVDPTTAPAFKQASAGREMMSLAARMNEALEPFVFGQIDGKGQWLSRLNGACAGICLEDYVAGALYGESPDEAYKVTTDSSVNPPEQLADGEVHVVAAVKISPFAEAVELELVKVDNTEALS